MTDHEKDDLRDYRDHIADFINDSKEDRKAL
jgi:hypothetical protein